MIRRSARLAAALAVTGLVLAACGDDDDTAGTDPTTATEAPGTTAGTDGTAAPASTAPAGTEAPATTDGSATTAAPATTAGDDGGSGWTVSTDDCVDPDAANAPIEGTVNIASAMPLSGGVAAAAFSPVAAGFQAYVDYANEQQLVPGHELALTIGDDQYNPQNTPNVVNAALDDGAALFSGIIGTPNNEAVRDTLNEECVPQLLALSGSPTFGEVADHPWTTGGLIPYDIESSAYVEDMKAALPDGGTVGLFYVNNDFGQVYQEAFETLAAEAGFEIVDSQTIEAADSNPPSSQLSSLASNAPDVIMAVPLGAQCPTFMTELANAKAANAGWEPRVYITSTCGSPLILSVAGAAANGLFTSASGGIQDITNPEVQASSPAVAEYVAYMESKGLGDNASTGAAGWVIGEATVEVLRQAAGSPEGLTRASIINAARNMDFVPTLVREGVTYTTSGEEDPFVAEDVQVVQYDAAARIFHDIGELNTSFRSS